MSLVFVECPGCKRSFTMDEDDFDARVDAGDGRIGCPGCLTWFDPFAEPKTSGAASDDTNLEMEP